MFRQAEVIAGFAGSALFNLCFCTSPKRVVMIAPDSYLERNEYLIASVLGHEIDLVWCKTDVRPPQNAEEDIGDFKAGFTFDFAREGVYLNAVLASL